MKLHIEVLLNVKELSEKFHNIGSTTDKILGANLNFERNITV